MTISIACPMYNEERTASEFITRVAEILKETNDVFEIVLVNDGSSDSTLSIILEHAMKDSRIRVIDLSRNFGKEAALSAALNHASGDAVIFIDADLQDPPEIIPELIRQWKKGFEVVLARRIDRSSDTWLKRATAEAFYRVHNKMADWPIPHNVGDCRLIDRKVVHALRQMPERQRFMKGLFSWVGFKTTVIDYVRQPRTAGHGKFTAWKLWNLALEGITSFSTLPLRVWTYVGACVALLAFAYGAGIIAKTLLFGGDVPGYASLLTVILFLGGIQLIGMGILGEYIGRIYAESKQRPLYIVRRNYSKKDDARSLQSDD